MNPFDALEIDPRMTPRELTEELRIRAERADDEEKQRIQTYWRMLTLKEADRVRWAIFAHPRPRSADSKSITALRAAIPPAIVRHPPVDLKPTLVDHLVFGQPVDVEEPDL